MCDGLGALVQVRTLTNTGTAALMIISFATAGDFAQTNNCGASLAAGANCTITVTFRPTAMGTRNGAITITDSAPGSPHTVPLSGVGADLVINPLPTPGNPTPTVVMVTQGGAANYMLSLAPATTFSETVTLNCFLKQFLPVQDSLGAPAGSTCTIRPPILTLSAASGAANVFVTVTTAAPSMMLRRRGPRLLPPSGGGMRLPWMLVGLTILMYLAAARRQRTLLPLGAAALLFVVVWTGCGGGAFQLPAGRQQNVATPPGTYTVTVRATTAGGVTHELNLTLTVTSR